LEKRALRQVVRLVTIEDFDAMTRRAAGASGPHDSQRPSVRRRKAGDHR